jgi:hypothetical protein
MLKYSSEAERVKVRMGLLSWVEFRDLGGRDNERGRLGCDSREENGIETGFNFTPASSSLTLRVLFCGVGRIIAGFSFDGD